MDNIFPTLSQTGFFKYGFKDYLSKFALDSGLPFQGVRELYGILADLNIQFGKPTDFFL